MKNLLLTMLLILPVYLQASENIYLQAGLGMSSLDVEPDYQINGVYEENSPFTIQGFLGRKFENNVSLDVGLMSHINFELFGAPIADSSNLSEGLVQLGYVFNDDEKLKFIPKVGYSYWRLHSTEGMFLNSGSEEESRISGMDFNYSATVVFRKLYLSYKTGDYEFGPVDSVMLGFGMNL